jgi:5-methylcytosine-specific restriction endonuclease McrA
MEVYDRMDKQMADVVACDLMRNDFMQKGWAVSTLASWLRQGCKCTYCGCDMLQSRDFAYFWQCADHILPQGKYPDLASSEWNMVLACSSCNRIKGQMDPNKSGGPVYTDQPLEQEQVATLVSRARKYIEDRRKELDLVYQQQQFAIRNALLACSSSKDPIR